MSSERFFKYNEKSLETLRFKGLELLTRFELVTSSLPRMRATDCAIAALSTQLRYYTLFDCSCQHNLMKNFGFFEKFFPDFWTRTAA